MNKKLKDFDEEKTAYIFEYAHILINSEDGKIENLTQEHLNGMKSHLLTFENLLDQGYSISFYKKDGQARYIANKK